MPITGCNDGKVDHVFRQVEDMVGQPCTERLRAVGLPWWANGGIQMFSGRYQGDAVELQFGQKEGRLPKDRDTRVIPGGAAAEYWEIGLKRGEREGQSAAPGWKGNEKQSSKDNLKREKFGSFRLSQFYSIPFLNMGNWQNPIWL